MRTILLSAVLLISFSLSAQTKKNRLYPFKSGVIEYTYSGNTTGTQVLYIDDYGFLQCEITKTETRQFGQTEKKNEVKLSKGLDIYQWDPETKKGTRIHNSLAEELMNDPDFDPEEFGKRTMESLGFTKSGEETLDGKRCEVYKGMGSTIWIWNGLALKTEVKLLGTKTVWTATSIRLDQGAPADKFKIPSDITIEDLGNFDPLEMMMKGMEEAEKEEAKSSGKQSEEESVDPAEAMKELKNLINNRKKN